MTIEYKPTREEETCERLLKDAKEMLSEAACTIVSEALEAATYAQLADWISYQREEYEVAMEEMRLAAAEITGRDRELLAKLWRAALAAAASLDPEDQTLAGYRTYRGDVHRYYRMWSGMVEEILKEMRMAERQAELHKEIAEREPSDPSDLPF